MLSLHLAISHHLHMMIFTALQHPLLNQKCNLKCIKWQTQLLNINASFPTLFRKFNNFSPSSTISKPHLQLFQHMSHRIRQPALLALQLQIHLVLQVILSDHLSMNIATPMVSVLIMVTIVMLQHMVNIKRKQPFIKEWVVATETAIGQGKPKLNDGVGP